MSVMKGQFPCNKTLVVSSCALHVMLCALDESDTKEPFGMNLLNSIDSGWARPDGKWRRVKICHDLK